MTGMHQLEVVARDGPIREANQDSAAARRARIGASRSESIEPSTRGFSAQRRARFGASKPKTGKGFLRGRPNRPRPTEPIPNRDREIPDRPRGGPSAVNGLRASRPNPLRTAHPIVKRHLSVYDEA